MKGSMLVFGLLVMALSVFGVEAHAQTAIFPVSTDLAQVKTDLLAWGTALIGIVLAIFAYRKVKSIAR
ncbi:hypothetical protein FBQ96_02990 [Nitrospirales bacterium NOB]|nr:MAG: hypothetical protein UZ03_NOB001001877 [Nitrospira sp. OLB3]MDL1888543.1 hypothetical protein [Nitrospirales bacterium NOB]